MKYDYECQIWHSFVNNTFVDKLEIENIEGGFAGPLTINKLTYTNPQWRVDVGRVYADITWRCAFEPRVCINNLEVENATVEQVSAAAENDTASEQSDTFALPLPVDVAQLTLKNVTVALLNANIAIENLK